MRANSLNCDIFCRVVDNYGDVGVCWRLARQLAAEHGYRVRLWVDRLETFARLCPSLDAGSVRQMLDGIEVRRWSEPLPAAAAADLVIEAFGCPLPQSYLAAMVARARPPAWINLEYLSAEHWVASHHGLPSPHPSLPLTKYFFIPGFTTASGGLLREADLLRRRRAWRTDWGELGLAAPGAGEIDVSLFCYEHPALPALLQAWSSGAQPLRCLLAPGAAQIQTAAWLGLTALEPGRTWRRGQLSLCALPFYPHQVYDHLLWACDLNLVRGEDSLVRAQWAGRPLLWQAYAQPQDAHLPKLAAFLEVYCANLAPATATAYANLARLYNDDPGSAAPPAEAWPAMLRQLPALAEHARRWADQLAAAEDLATRLVKFIEPLI